MICSDGAVINDKRNIPWINKSIRIAHQVAGRSHSNKSNLAWGSNPQRRGRTIRILLPPPVLHDRSRSRILRQRRNKNARTRNIHNSSDNQQQPCHPPDFYHKNGTRTTHRRRQRWMNEKILRFNLQHQPKAAPINRSPPLLPPLKRPIKRRSRRPTAHRRM